MATHKPVKTMSGVGQPPNSVKWDGRNSAGEIVPKGNYLLKLSVKDEAGNTSDSEDQEITVAASKGGAPEKKP